MSELKIYRTTLKLPEWKILNAEVYLKSEADAFIVKLKEGAKNLILDNYLKDKEARHSNYKRCLAMAERCKFRMYYLSTIVDYELSKLIPNPTAVKRYTKKESRMDYWKNRWLELAEKFKEAE